MKFRNYCVIFMANVDGVEDEIKRISESKLNILNAKGVIIITFTSNIEPIELSDYLKLNGRSFFVFDLNIENSGFFINKPEIFEGLFGFLRESNSNTLISATNELIGGIKEDNIQYNILTTSTKELSLEDKLDEAIKAEDYILAAKIRDEINNK